jgi:hypothetical protein
MFITRGFGDWERRGMERIVRRATEVTFVLRMVL